VLNLSSMPPIERLRHPGPPQQDRRQAVATVTTPVQIVLRPGIRLIDAVDEALDAHGIGCAQIEFTGGVFDRISHCIPACSADGSTAMSYSDRREAKVPAQLLTASATVGYRDGERFMHCHAAWLDADGEIRAGHLWPETTIGPVPMYAVMHTLPGVSLLSSHDPETKMPTFVPHGEGTGSLAEHGKGLSRSGVCRILPNEDIVEAAEAVCESLGFEHAVVRASLGSFVGAHLQHGDDEDVLVDGPATEVVNVVGTVNRDNTELSTILVDRHGAVHAGRLIRGRNLVAVTFELFIVEDKPFP